MINLEKFSRQLDLVDPSVLDFPIAIIGAGGIGSWTALALGKMGCNNISVFDFDEVEIHNLGSQIYSEEHLGKHKVEALKSTLDRLLDGNLKGNNHQVKQGEVQFLKDYSLIISAVDSIEVRRWIFEGLKGERKMLIDGRMAGNAVQIFAVPLDDKKKVEDYEDSLFLVEEADPTPCSEKAVVYNCFVISGLITDLVGQLVGGKEVPFELVMDLQNFTLFS